MMKRGSAAAACLAVVMAVQISCSAVNRQERSMLDRLTPLVLPENLVRATDVRWLAEDQIHIRPRSNDAGRDAWALECHETSATGCQLLLGIAGVGIGVTDAGVYAWRIGEDDADVAATLDGSGLWHFTFGAPDYSRVGGAGAGGIVFAGERYGVYLQNEGGVSNLELIDTVGDIDRQGGLTAAVGLGRGGRQRGGENEERSWDDRVLRFLNQRDWADHVAWLFEDGADVPLPLLPTRDGGGEMARCRQAELSVVRFIADDLVLVLPGSEPGVFVYDTSGELVDSLAAATFLADDGCRVGKDAETLLYEGALLVDWLAKRRIIDEVVADGAGNVYFFVRHVPGGVESRDDAPPFDPDIDPNNPPRARVCWDLVHARVGNLTDVTSVPCAVESNLADSRLRADLQGEDAVILIRGFTALRARDADLFTARIVPPRQEGG